LFDKFGLFKWFGSFLAIFNGAFGFIHPLFSNFVGCFCPFFTDGLAFFLNKSGNPAYGVYQW